MTPESARFLDKARRLLIGAAAMLHSGFIEAAGRDTYLAGYHAAQSFITETNGKPAKTHTGVKSEFSRLTKDDPRITHDLRAFLFSSARLKEIADYELGPVELPRERVAEAIETAKRFIDCVIVLQSTPHNGNHQNPTAKL
jgi:uncharacterized protein (UPF0332 family)